MATSFFIEGDWQGLYQAQLRPGSLQVGTLTHSMALEPQSKTLKHPFRERHATIQNRKGKHEEIEAAKNLLTSLQSGFSHTAIDYVYQVLYAHHSQLFCAHHNMTMRSSFLPDKHPENATALRNSGGTPGVHVFTACLLLPSKTRPRQLLILTF